MLLDLGLPLVSIDVLYVRFLVDKSDVNWTSQLHYQRIE